MNSTTIVLLILVAIYIPTFIFVKKNKWCQEHGIVTSGPLVMIKTKLGIKMMDRLAKYKRFWRVCGFASRIITILLMGYIVILLVIDVIAIPGMTTTGGLGIEYALAIPGLNPMLPIVYGWIALIISMVVHETAHGIQTRANDMNVKATGVIHCVVPLGAFVEPDEEQVQKCSRRARMDLYAAGITTNFILAMILFAAMVGGLTGGMASDFEDSPAVYGIVADSPAHVSGIPSSAIITTIAFEEENPFEVKTLDELNNYIDSHHYGDYTISYIYKDTKDAVTMPIGAYVKSVVEGGPAYTEGIPGNSFIISMTQYEPDQKTQIGPEYEFGTSESWTDFINGTKENQVYKVKYVYVGTGVEKEVFVKLGNNNGKGYLGVTVPTTSGITFTTPNEVLQTAVNPFHNRETIQEQAIGFLSYLSSAFAGFSPIPESTQWWFHSTSFIPDDIFWIGMKLIYWTFWLNILLGVTNALPAVPFDGGFLFMGGVDYLLEKIGRMKDTEKREALASKITTVSSILSIGALILVLFVVIF